MSRHLLANGRPIRRSQLKELRRQGQKIHMGFAPGTDRATGNKIKSPPRRKGGI